jgi:hypothetical protein
MPRTGCFTETVSTGRAWTRSPRPHRLPSERSIITSTARIHCWHQFLANQNDLALARIRRWADKARGEPVRIVGILFAELETWAKQPGWTGTGFTRVAMELADMPGHPGRVAASRHKAAVEQWLTAQFTAKQVRKPAVLARQVVLLIEGCQSIALIHGNVKYIKAAGETARRIIKQQHSE